MNSKYPQRRSLRLKDYDYSQAGAYFVTIVVNHRESLFGSIENDVFVSNPGGIEISRIWMDLAVRFPSIELDEFCVMPNHFHGIVFINSPLDSVGAALVTARNTIEP
jgi:putative transposase